MQSKQDSEVKIMQYASPVTKYRVSGSCGKRRVAGLVLFDYSVFHIVLMADLLPFLIRRQSTVLQIFLQTKYFTKHRINYGWSCDSALDNSWTDSERAGGREEKQTETAWMLSVWILLCWVFFLLWRMSVPSKWLNTIETPLKVLS